MGDYNNNRLFCVGQFCPMMIVLHLPCPGCGLTRAGFALLRLDLAGAYRIHPFIYPIAGYIAVFGWNRYIKGRRMGKKLKAGLIVLMALVILFYGWRMWMYFPGEPPMSYYERNLVRFLSGRMLR